MSKRSLKKFSVEKASSLEALLRLFEKLDLKKTRHVRLEVMRQDLIRTMGEMIADMERQIYGQFATSPHDDYLDAVKYGATGISAQLNGLKSK